MSDTNKTTKLSEDNELKFNNISKYLKAIIPLEHLSFKKNETNNEKRENKFDSDLNIVTRGTNLKKYNPNKHSLSERFYHLDLINYCLVASTKEFQKKEKYCKLLLSFFDFKFLKLLIFKQIHCLIYQVATKKN
jgi:hypothetical protein